MVARSSSIAQTKSRRNTPVFSRVRTDFAPRVGARAACRAREGIGGSETKPIVQTKSAADSRLSRLPAADGADAGLCTCAKMTYGKHRGFQPIWYKNMASA